MGWGVTREPVGGAEWAAEEERSPTCFLPKAGTAETLEMQAQEAALGSLRPPR